NGIDALHDLAKVPLTIKYKVDTATEETRQRRETNSISLFFQFYFDDGISVNVTRGFSMGMALHKAFLSFSIL
ncbi:MAG: hypothetical protein WBF33_14435, partial [Candidatus Nitrosopolaris sp.]